MHKITKDAVLILMAVIALLFLITVYFVGFNGEGLIFSTFGRKMGTVNAEMPVSETHKKIEDVISVEIPQIHYIGETRTVGDSVIISDIFEIEYEDGTVVLAKDDQKGSITLSDIRDMSDNTVLTKLTTEDVESLEDIPTAFVYDKELDILYCHRSGVYRVYIKYYSGSASGVLYEFLLPVEVEVS